MSSQLPFLKVKGAVFPLNNSQCSLLSETTKYQPSIAVHVHVLSVWWMVFSYHAAMLANSSEYYHVPANTRVGRSCASLPSPSPLSLCLPLACFSHLCLSLTHCISRGRRGSWGESELITPSD